MLSLFVSGPNAEIALYRDDSGPAKTTRVKLAKYEWWFYSPDLVPSIYQLFCRLQRSLERSLERRISLERHSKFFPIFRLSGKKELTRCPRRRVVDDDGANF
ncbi:unnamed protein product [Haemonchus placei]|uniref:Uncharacterized protein n=1 Tax=Haemonchus placei TaxID=6290 RepID=A0A0N4WCI4_HAEPC|nr:unnamed protein product [Haemonchus placei]